MEDNKLKQEKDILDSNNNNNINFHFLYEITKDSYSDICTSNIFTIFKSNYNILYLIYSNNNKAIIGFDLNQNKKIIEIKNCHKNCISNLRHYFNEINKTDLILSVSYIDNNIKIWDTNKWECILNLTSVNKKGFLISAYFIKDNDQIYVITSNYTWNNKSEPIKIFDFKGNITKKINESNDMTFFIDTYYNNKMKYNFIISGNYNYIKSFNYDKNELYHIYYDNDNKSHFSVIIKDDEEIIKLIESCIDGFIRIWDFNSGLLLKKINIKNKCLLYSLCLLDNNYLFITCEDRSIKLIDLKKEKIIQSLFGHNNRVLHIEKINLNKYGDCLISQGYQNDQIRIWSYKYL